MVVQNWEVQAGLQVEILWRNECNLQVVAILVLLDELSKRSRINAALICIIIGFTYRQQLDRNQSSLGRSASFFQLSRRSLGCSCLPWHCTCSGREGSV